MKNKILLLQTILIIFLLTGCMGCGSSTQLQKLKYTKSDVSYEIYYGFNASAKKEIAETDVSIDKDRFVDLYNENLNNDKPFVKFNTVKGALFINGIKEPEKMEQINNTEVYIKAFIDGQTHTVSVYEFNDDLYFFLYHEGNKNSPDKFGSHYRKLPDELAAYWVPVLKEIKTDATEAHLKKYGSFSIDRIYTFDNKYETDDAFKNSEKLFISITARRDVTDTHPLNTTYKRSDFYGACFEKDNYNLWLQMKDGFICYRYKDGEWDEAPDAKLPDYIICRSQEDS